VLSTRSKPLSPALAALLLKASVRRRTCFSGNSTACLGGSLSGSPVSTRLVSVRDTLAAPLRAKARAGRFTWLLIAVMAELFHVVPAGLRPAQDKLIPLVGFAQLPEAASLDRNRGRNPQMSAGHLRQSPGIRNPPEI